MYFFENKSVKCRAHMLFLIWSLKTIKSENLANNRNIDVWQCTLSQFYSFQLRKRRTEKVFQIRMVNLCLQTHMDLRGVLLTLVSINFNFITSV